MSNKRISILNHCQVETCPIVPFHCLAPMINYRPILQCRRTSRHCGFIYCCAIFSLQLKPMVLRD